ncbi:hypothetical protein [Helicobacter ganmani]|uniref:hypothetical protein n=1 Tax=Helicobacter ganmani TaxID=60246 RepID=UPI003A84A1B2
MKKIVLFFLLMFGISYAGLMDVLDAVSTGVDRIGAPSAREKQLMQKEFEKADREAMKLADKRMQYCMQIFEIVNQHSESEAERIIKENKELNEYVEYMRANETERKRCENREKREILIREQEQKAHEQEIDDTSCLYHLLEM